MGLKQPARRVANVPPVKKVKYMELKIHVSTFDGHGGKRLLTVRDMNGSASGFKEDLFKAGFEPGDVVVVVTKERYDLLQRIAANVASNVGKEEV